MNYQPEAPPTQTAKEKIRKKRSGYRWIVGNIPFFLFLSFLAVVYIYNGHYSDKTVRAINEVSKQVKDMEYAYKILQGEVTFRSKQSELAKAVRPLGLEVLVEPAPVLSDSLMKNNQR